MEIAGVFVAEEIHLKLLEVMFDFQLSYHRHLHAVAEQTSQRPGLLGKATPRLNPHSRQTVYCGSVVPVVEYCQLV